MNRVVNHSKKSLFVTSSISTELSTLCSYEDNSNNCLTCILDNYAYPVQGVKSLLVLCLYKLVGAFILMEQNRSINYCRKDKTLVVIDT